MPVTFFDYYWLLEMYEGIFLRNQDAFESETEEPVVLDVGSNIGLATLFFKRLFPRANVVAFEPDPQAYELLTDVQLGCERALSTDVVVKSLLEEAWRPA